MMPVKNRFKPMLFSTEMVKALLEGRKTQTRRIVKEAIGWDANWKISKKTETSHCMCCGSQYSLPYFKPQISLGDIIWVRETFGEDFLEISESGVICHYLYRADDFETPADGWSPSIFMPKSACRLFLKVTNVRVERLQDISDFDSIAEGIEIMDDYPTYRNYLKFGGGHGYNFSHYSYFSLWDSINGKGAADKNPYVWVYEFEKVEKPDGFF